ncbi:hypothetical protein ANO11243_033740 [Dothideomycetidae sp. 11243]|nr:hypothetical protein ANO11243_033740 [fungal sp. No.11243]
MLNVGRGTITKEYSTLNIQFSHSQRVLRIVINENEDEIPKIERTWGYEHAIHCLNMLRESVMCNADDTPLYTGNLHGKTQIEMSARRAGVGENRMCRDWSKLMNWSRAHSACYNPLYREGKEFRELDKYKFCPDGSKPWLKNEGKQGT